MKAMEIDEEEIPSLVNVGESKRAISPMSSQLQDLSLSRVPLTIVTGTSNSTAYNAVCANQDTIGYLGAGKTTLVNYILREQHGKKIAVILNGLYTP